MCTVGLEGVDGGSGWRVRHRPRLGWMYGMKVALGSMGKMVKVIQQYAKDRKE